MRKSYLHWLTLAILGMCLVVSSCQKEQDYPTPSVTEVRTPYDYPGRLDLRLARLVDRLRSEEDSLRFAHSLSQLHAQPLWEHAVLEDQGIDTLAFVPVYNPQTPEEIHTIWIFQLHRDGSYQQRFLHRSEQASEIEWGFDYFTVFALGKRPHNGSQFAFLGENGARAAFRHCIRYGVGGVDLEGTEHLEWRTKCWDEDIWQAIDPSVDGDPHDRRSGDSGDFGGGGGGPSWGEYRPPVNSPMLFDELFDKIDQTPSFAKSRVKAVFDILVSESTLVSMITKFFQGKRAIANLILTVGTIPEENSQKGVIYAATYGPSDKVGDGGAGRYNVEIRINSKYVNLLTREGLTSVLLHELLHANLLAKALSVASERGVIIRDYIKYRDYPAVYEAFFPRGGGPFEGGHELYGVYYKEDFISILKKATNKSLGKEAYEMLFWVGLHKTDAWKRLPEEKRNKYLEQYKSFLLQ